MSKHERSTDDDLPKNPDEVDQDLWEQCIRACCNNGEEVDGKKVLLVDGAEIKVRYYMDAVEGMNGWRYDWMPKDEIWIDNNLSEKNWPFILYHECWESRLMSQGESYDVAHKRANGVEKVLREKFLEDGSFTMQENSQEGEKSGPVINTGWVRPRPPLGQGNYGWEGEEHIGCEGCTSVSEELPRISDKKLDNNEKTPAERAEHADLIRTKIKEKSCGNCIFLTEAGYCFHKEVDLPISSIDDPKDLCCFLPNNLVQGEFFAASKAIYSGEAIEITMAMGNRITLTVNHPVFSENGFVPAGSLQEGDYLVCYSGDVKSSLIRTTNPSNVKNGPTLIEEVFHSLQNSVSVPPTIIRPNSLNFHGDGEFFKSNVHVVRSNRLLRCASYPKSLQGLKNFRFSFSNDDESFLSSDRSVDPRLLSMHRLKMISTTSKPVLTAYSSPNFFDGSTSISVMRCFSRRQHSFPHEVHSITPRSESNSGLGKSILNCPVRYPENFLEFSDRFPREVSINKIICVNRFHYEGPVYDAQTTTGFIIAEGIYVSNCSYWDAQGVERVFGELSGQKSYAPAPNKYWPDLPGTEGDHVVPNEPEPYGHDSYNPKTPGFAGEGSSQRRLTARSTASTDEKSLSPEENAPVIAVDFDGTIAERTHHLELSRTLPRDGAKEALEYFWDAGFKIALWTGRNDLEDVTDWLDDYRIPYDYVNENPTHVNGSRKIEAAVYIDDRTISAQQPWSNITEEVFRSLGRERYQRTKHLIITGSSGSGKTYLSNLISRITGMPVINADNNEIWHDREDIKDDPERFREGTKAYYRFRKLLKYVVRKALKQTRPSIIEGVQFLLHPGILRGHHILLIDADESTVIRQRLQRDAELGKLTPYNQEERIGKARDLYYKWLPYIERMKRFGEVDTVTPDQLTIQNIMEWIHGYSRIKSLIGTEDKAMSAINETTGGALVGPPHFGSTPERRRTFIGDPEMPYRLPDEENRGQRGGLKDPVAVAQEQGAQVERSPVAHENSLMMDPEGVKDGWVTIRGARCYIENGEIVKGPQALLSKHKNFDKLRKKYRKKIQNGWVTIRGAPCFIEDGKITKGPKALVDGSKSVEETDEKDIPWAYDEDNYAGIRSLKSMKMDSTSERLLGKPKESEQEKVEGSEVNLDRQELLDGHKKEDRDTRRKRIKEDKQRKKLREKDFDGINKEYDDQYDKWAGETESVVTVPDNEVWMKMDVEQKRNKFNWPRSIRQQYKVEVDKLAELDGIKKKDSKYTGIHDRHYKEDDDITKARKGEDDARKTRQKKEIEEFEAVRKAGTKSLSFKQKGWITIGGHSEGGEQHVDGTKVYIDNNTGEIKKGAENLQGSKLKKTKKKPKIEDTSERLLGNRKKVEKTHTDLNESSQPTEPVHKEKVEKQAEKYIKTLTDDVKNKIIEYTANAYEGLNKAMRKCPPDFNCLEGNDKEMVDVLEKAIQNAPKFSKPVNMFRGMSNLSPKIQESLVEIAEQTMKSGDVFSLPSFTSGTTNPTIAVTAFGTSAKGSLVFQIRAKSGLPVKSISDAPLEDEIIQSPKTKYRVAGVKDTEYKIFGGKINKKTIYLEEE